MPKRRARGATAPPERSGGGDLATGPPLRGRLRVPPRHALRRRHVRGGPKRRPRAGSRGGGADHRGRVGEAGDVDQLGAEADHPLRRRRPRRRRGRRAGRRDRGPRAARRRGSGAGRWRRAELATVEEAAPPLGRMAPLSARSVLLPAVGQRFGASCGRPQPVGDHPNDPAPDVVVAGRRTPPT